MAKRNYKAEEARRNALAHSLGFKNRAALRRAIERGERPAIRPKQLKNPRTIAAQARLKATAKPQSFAELFKTIPKEERAREWSTLFAKHESAQYEHSGRSSIAKRKRKFIATYGKDFYTDLYLAAFVSGQHRYDYVRHRGGSPELQEWLAEVTGYVTDSEYDERYE